MESPSHTTRLKVLWMNEPFAADPELVDRIKREMDVVQCTQIDDKDKETEQMEHIVREHGQFDAVLWFFSFHVASFWPHINVRTRILEPLLPRLKFLCNSGAGYDSVDIEYLTGLGIQYANNPNAPMIRTADTCVAMIGSAMRAFHQQDARVRAGLWADTSIPGIDARGRTLGIVGMGGIGRKVADTMAFLGMRIIYTKRTPLPPSEVPDGWEHVSLEELLRRSDVVSVHCPLNEETRGMIGEKEFAMMKPRAIFINTSRGPVISEQALVNALTSDPPGILRAALDVYEDEPRVHEGLRGCDRVLLLPHIGPFNDTLFESMQEEGLANLESWARTGRAVTPVNGPFGWTPVGTGTKRTVEGPRVVV